MILSNSEQEVDSLEASAPQPAIKPAKRSLRENAALFSDLGKIGADLQGEDRAAFDAMLANSFEPDDDRARAALTSYFAERYDKPAGEIADYFDQYASDYAQNQLKEFGELSPSALYGRVGAEVKRDVDEQDMLGGSLNALYEAAIRGETDYLKAWQAGESARRANPAYRPERSDSYRAIAKQAWNEIIPKVLAYAPQVEAVTSYLRAATKDGEGAWIIDIGDQSKTDLLQKAKDALEFMPEEEAQTAIAMAMVLSRGDAGDTFVSKAGSRLSESVLDMAEGVQTLASRPFAALTMKDSAGAISDINKRARVSHLLRQARMDTGLIRGNNWFSEGILSAISSVPYMLASLTPQGIAVNISSAKESISQRYQDNGMAAAQANNTASIAALPYVALDFVQAKMVFGGKLPGFEKLLTAPVKTGMGLAARAGGVGALQFAEQYAQEVAQDLTAPTVQSLASIFSKEIPGVDWNKEFAGIADAAPETAAALLPLVLIGTGTSTFKDRAYGQQYLAQEKYAIAIGFSPELSAQIASAPTLEEKQQIVRDNWDSRQMGTEAQAQAVREINSEVSAVNDSQFKVEKLPDNTFAILDPNGEQIDTAQTAEAAAELVLDHERASEAGYSQTIADMKAYVEGFQEPGQSMELVKGTKSLSAQVKEGLITPASARDAVRVAIDLGKLEEGATVETTQVSGENIATFDLKDRVYKDISRIYEGAAPEVIIEEHTEGYIKRRLAAGDVTLDQLNGWREKTDGVTDFDRSERAAKEWFSQQATAYLFGKQMDPAVPKSFRAYLRKFKEYFTKVMQAAANLVKMEREGTLPEDFRVNLAQSVGLDRRYLEGIQPITEPLAPAEFAGIQEGIPGKIPDFELYNATQKIGDTPVGSTVSRQTIEKAGYKLPERTFSLSQTETPEFKKWFGDSKVVDADGKPMVVYHGTRGGFTVFDYSKIGQQGRSEGAGFYFTNSEQVASGYGNKMEVFLSIKKPLAYDAKGFSKAVIQRIVKRIAELEAQSEGADISDGFLSNFGDVRSEGLQAIIRQAADLISSDGKAIDQLSGIVGGGVKPQYVNTATREITGYDGITADGFSNAGDASNRIFVAFFPEQIKSATGNRGAFDPENPDITFALTSETKAQEIQAKFRERRVTQRIANREGPAASYPEEVAKLVKDKMYEVRGLRKEHARVQEIMAKGLPEAERLFFSDANDLHPMTKVGIGMALSETYAKAGNYDRAAEMAERVADLGTQAGQSINMFKLLGAMLDSPEKALAFFARQRGKVKRNVKQKREVEAATEDIEKELEKSPKTAEELEQGVVNRMRARGLDTPKEVRDAIKRIIELKDEGKLPTRKISDLIAQKYMVPDMTSEERTQLSGMADRVARLPQQSVYRADAILDMMNFMDDKLSSIGVADKLWSIWYGSVLSGYNTHIRNVTGNAVELLSTSFVDTLVRNPAEWYGAISKAFYGSKRGAATGLKEGYRHFAPKGLKGLVKDPLAPAQSVIGRTDTDKFSAGGVLERVNFAGGKLNPYNYLRYVGRLLRAEDSVAFHTAYELKSFQSAAEMVEAEGLEGDAAEKRVLQLLNLTDIQQKEFADRAAAEWENLEEGDITGNKEAFVRRRVIELTQMERDGALVERATDYANRVTYNYKPEGLLGAMAEQIIALIGDDKTRVPGESKRDAGVRSAVLAIPRSIVPFARTVANVTNRQLDFVFGVPRSIQKTTFIMEAGRKKVIEKTADQRAIELKKGIVGASGLIAAYFLMSPEDDDSTTKDTIVRLHGAGPSNSSQRQALELLGWKPWSLQIGDKYYPFRYMPIGIGLASVAEMHDNQRYKERSEESATQRAGYALSAVGAATLDASYLSNLSDFMGSLNQRDADARAASLNRFVQRTFNAGNLAPFSNLVLNVTTDLDTYDRDRSGANAFLASQVPVSQVRGKPAIDIFGDAIENRAFEAFVGRAKAEGPEERLYRLMVEKDAFPSGLRTYQGKMEPEQFYEFQRVRGAALKQLMLRNEKNLRAASGDDAKDLVQKWSRIATLQAKQAVGYEEPK